MDKLVYEGLLRSLIKLVDAAIHDNKSIDDFHYNMNKVGEYVEEIKNIIGEE